MINIRKNYVTLAVAGVLGLGATAALAVDFPASATVENVLEVTVVTNFELGTLFAVSTGESAAAGVGALKISPLDGTPTEVFTPAAATPPLTSIINPVPGQGSVTIVSDFILQFPDTSDITEAGMADATNTLAIYEGTGQAVELSLTTGDGTEPALWLMHFTVSDVSGGGAVEAATNEGQFDVSQDADATEYVFNIGATVTTEPFTTTEANYLVGTYSGIIPITATY